MAIDGLDLGVLAGDFGDLLIVRLGGSVAIDVARIVLDLLIPAKKIVCDCNSRKCLAFDVVRHGNGVKIVQPSRSHSSVKSELHKLYSQKVKLTRGP